MLVPHCRFKGTVPSADKPPCGDKSKQLFWWWVTRQPKAAAQHVIQDVHSAQHLKLCVGYVRGQTQADVFAASGFKIEVGFKHATSSCRAPRDVALLLVNYLVGQAGAWGGPERRLRVVLLRPLYNDSVPSVLAA